MTFPERCGQLRKSKLLLFLWGKRKKPSCLIIFTSFYEPWKPGCSVSLDWQKRKCTAAHKKECGGNKKKNVNETSAPIYLCDVLAFVVFKCRGYFHLLCCLINSLRDCDLSFKQQKGKNSFSSWKQIKWAEARKAPFVLIFQTSKQISIHANMYLNLLQIKGMHSI